MITTLFAATLYVFGDSSCLYPESPQAAWPQVIQQETGNTVIPLCKSGSRLMQHDLPRWLRCGWGDKAVVMLGGNDRRVKLTPKQVGQHAERFFKELRYIGQCETHVVIPSFFNTDDSLTWWINKAITKAKVEGFNISYDPDKLRDGAHANEELHYIQAMEVMQQIGWD